MKHCHSMDKLTAFASQLTSIFERCVTSGTMTLAYFMIDGRIDYCNVFYMKLLQPVFRNNSACTTLWLMQSLTGDVFSICQTLKPVIAPLHWLLVDYRVQFKIAVTTFKKC